MTTRKFFAGAFASAFTSCEFIAVLTVAAAVFTASPSSATTMTVDVTGSITSVPFPALTVAQVGDTITLHGVFDSASLVDKSATFGIPVCNLEALPLARMIDSLTVDMPGQHWIATNDGLYGLSVFGVKIPHIVLLNGKFYGLDFFGIQLPNHNTILLDAADELLGNLPHGIILGGNDDPNAPPFWIGSWNLDTAQVNTTPLPAALSLFATGIGGLGLLGWRRKRKAQAAA